MARLCWRNIPPRAITSKSLLESSAITGRLLVIIVRLCLRPRKLRASARVVVPASRIRVSPSRIKSSDALAMATLPALLT